MRPAARVADAHVCPTHAANTVVPPCEPSVLIGNLSAARIADAVSCPSFNAVVQGERTVLIGNMMAARLGDPTAHGGNVVLGDATVLIGGAPQPPVIGQGTPMSCGIATSRMIIFARTGRLVDEATLRAQSQTFGGMPYSLANGTDTDNMQELLEANGVPASDYDNGASLAELQAATTDGRPAIVHVPGHFIVVDEVRTNPDGSQTIVGRDPWAPGQGTPFEETPAQFAARNPDGILSSD